MIMFYVTFILMCPNLPDYLVFIRSQSPVLLAKIYGELLSNSHITNGLGMGDNKDNIKCNAENIQFQSEVLKDKK